MRSRLRLPCLAAACLVLACAGTPDEGPAGEAAAEAASPCRAGCSHVHPDCGGWVRLAYDVTPRGVVENARVLESCPAGRHDDAALGVISRWRYPEGEEARRDIRIQIDFAEPADAAEPGETP